jgi:DNA-directed RNA polymerase
MLQHDPLWAAEIKLETDARSEGIGRYRRLVEQATSRGDAPKLRAVERLLVGWFKPLRNLIAAEKRKISLGQAGHNYRVIGPVLKAFPTARLAVTAMHEVMGMLLAEPHGATPVRLSLAIARSLNAQVNFKLMRAQHLEGRRAGFEANQPCRYGHPAWDALMHTHRRRITGKATNRVAARFNPTARWPLVVQAKVGACLLDLFARAARLPDGEGTAAALDQRKFWSKNHCKWFWLLSPLTRKIIADGHDFRQLLAPRLLPMVVPPLKWTEADAGGYLQLPVSFIKRVQRLSAPARQENPEMREAINAINSCPWRVNRWIYDVVRAVAEAGGGLAGVPSLQHLDYPPKPSDYDASEMSHRAWKKRAQWVYRKNIELKGEARTLALTMSVAERMLDFERFYLPHQLDSRGRLYPLPVLFHHQGPDLCRGMMEFAEPVDASGERAQFWLKVHLAGCCGIDKETFEDRVAWVDEGIRSGAFLGWIEEPLKNTGWMLMDDPFQALAAARAVWEKDAAAHLPVGIDGTNNALQHYAAMIRDEHAARMVNVLPSEKPQDFYAEIAQHVDAIVARDAEWGHSSAAMLLDIVDRKLCKTTAMTNYYGVTAVGARRQMYDNLKRIGFVSDQLYPASKYLGQLVLKATEGVCPAIQAALNWFRACARIIAQSGRPVRWTSPIGMEVEQPYRNSRKLRCRTPFHILCLAAVDDTCPPKVCRQINGFAPNYVHSIDASLVMSCAIHCADKGIRFAAVHDRHIAHAGHIETVGEITRQHFVIIHEEPLLEQLWSELKDRNQLELPPPPPVGDLDIQRVMESKYIFS